MQGTTVSSNLIKSIGYKDQALEITFSDGRVYQYFDMPALLHTELMNAHDVDKFYEKTIRGQYPFLRLH